MGWGGKEGGKGGEKTTGENILVLTTAKVS